MPAADLEVVRVVRGCHLDRAGAELGIDVVVGDNGDAATGEGKLDLGADEVCVTLVVGMHRDGGVAEHRLGTGGRDDDAVLRVVNAAVPDRDKLALVLAVLDLDVGQRSQAARAPVDDALGAVDETVVVQPLEDREDGAREPFVHREPLA